MLLVDRQLEAVRSCLRTFLIPGQTCEIRALEVRGARALSFVSADVEALAAKALEWDHAEAKGVYFTPNPLRPDLAGGRASARKADVSRRHWLLIDVDPSRPPDCSSTDEERAAAWRVLEVVRGTLDAAGFVGVVVGDSGSGFHADYPIDLPNDDAGQELVKAVLVGLQKRCGDAAAQVDAKTFDAPRIWKLYGTKARKGPDAAERPHRYAAQVEGPPWEETAAQRNTALLSRLIEMWAYVEDVRKGRPDGDPVQRAKNYVAKEPPAVSGQHGHDRTFHVACVLVKDFGLDQSQAWEAIQDWNRTCQPPWEEADLRRKLAEAAKKAGPVGKLLNGTNGHTTNGDLNGHKPKVNADTSDDPLDADATAADLIKANSTIRWAWEKWLPCGVLSVLASEPGVGKTRFCMDLARRIFLGLPWPDGALPSFPKGSTTLWVPADNQHPELGSLPVEYGFPPEAVYLNATRRNPFVGNILDEPADLKDFESRILRVKPAIVIIDTSLNATDRSSHKPEDAKAFFVPLQQIATRTGVVMLCVTHLNVAGKPLGRRIMGQARCVMQLENPDPDGTPHRRKLYIVKSNSLFPPPLGVTMSAACNEYDDKPPSAPEDGGGGHGGGKAPGVNPRLQLVMTWLREHLAEGPQQIGITISAAESFGFNKQLLYRGKDSIGIETFEAEGRKWWKLTSNEDEVQD